MQHDVVVIGSLNVDLLIIGDAPTEIEQLTQWSGLADIHLCTAGAIGYTVQDLQRLGVNTGAISCIGADALGKFALKELKLAGLDTQRIRVRRNALSAVASYVLLFGSRKRPLAFRMATHDPWPRRFSDADLRYISQARLLHSGGYLHFKDMWKNGEMERVYRHARRNNLTTVLDPQFPVASLERPWASVFGDLLKYVDILLLDENEAMNLTDTASVTEAANKALSYGPKVVVVKQGEKGALVRTPSEAIEQPAYKDKVEQITDSIGAGDAFDAGFILGTLEGWSIAKSAEFAARLAASTLKGVGGTSSLARREEIESLLA